MKRGGFTIVELLIVIVVVGILAAITVIAYNGIQNRAYETKALNVVKTYETALKLYKVEHGEWPPYEDDDSGDAWVCLGSTAQFPANDGFSAGECETWGGPSVTTDDDFMTELSGFIDSPVSGELPTVDYGDGRARGVQFYSHNPSIDYYVNGSQGCPRGDKAVINGNTRCIVYLE